jgi:hypothetical protein
MGSPKDTPRAKKQAIQPDPRDWTHRSCRSRRGGGAGAGRSSGASAGYFWYQSKGPASFRYRSSQYHASPYACDAAPVIALPPSLPAAARIWPWSLPGGFRGGPMLVVRWDGLAGSPGPLCVSLDRDGRTVQIFG